MLELLAPAGSPESVIAAVQSGADAIYLGYGAFNARRNAVNFNLEELTVAVAYCHLRGVKVYLTLNTLIRDRELPKLAETAVEAAKAGIDAILVQDLGVLHTLQQVIPHVPLHGSTQMTVHSLDGVKACADLGMERVVLSRELSRDAIGYICQRSPIEIETFVHGALCMCYSGQCLFSSVIGGRSGNRGLCAQPCRLNYGWGTRADGAPLSLKDMSLAGHVQELEEMGVACLKLEGRMKRPEYVAVVAGIYSRAIREQREPTQEEMSQLETAFSRQGFTDGYFTDQQNKSMFGIRTEGKDPRELFAQVKADYTKGEHRPQPITMSAIVKADQPAQLVIADEADHVVTVTGATPEPARNRPLTREEVQDQLGKTGGTAFTCDRPLVQLDEGLSLPRSALNSLRREALEQMTALRTAIKPGKIGDYRKATKVEKPSQPPELTVSLRSADQLSQALLETKPAMVYLPVSEAHKHPQAVEELLGYDIPVGLTLPRICWDREQNQLGRQLADLRGWGCYDVQLGTLDLHELCRDMGFLLHADYGLGLCNSWTAHKLDKLEFVSATPSFELKWPQIRDLQSTIALEAIVYGRLPLMITEQQLQPKGKQTGNISLIDRKGERFPVLSAPGSRSEIFNGKTLFLADKAQDYGNIGLSRARLLFTTESASDCLAVTQAYQGVGNYQPQAFTRGLYYRDVE